MWRICLYSLSPHCTLSSLLRCSQSWVVITWKEIAVIIFAKFWNYPIASWTRCLSLLVLDVTWSVVLRLLMEWDVHWLLHWGFSCEWLITHASEFPYIAISVGWNEVFALHVDVYLWVVLTRTRCCILYQSYITKVYWFWGTPLHLLRISEILSY